MFVTVRNPLKAVGPDLISVKREHCIRNQTTKSFHEERNLIMAGVCARAETIESGRSRSNQRQKGALGQKPNREKF